MKNNNGFTLIELLGVIATLAIVSGIAVLSINNYLKNSKDSVYLNYASTLKTTSENFLIENYDRNSQIIPNINEEKVITLKDLIEANKIEELKDPSGGYCDTLNTKIVIKRLEDTGINFNLTYSIYLNCPHALITCSPYTTIKECTITKK